MYKCVYTQTHTAKWYGGVEWNGISHIQAGTGVACLNEHFSIIELWNAFDNYLSGLIVFPSARTDGSVNWTKMRMYLRDNKRRKKYIMYKYITTTSHEHTFLSCMRNTNLIGIKWKRAFLIPKREREREREREWALVECLCVQYNWLFYPIRILYRYIGGAVAAVWRDWRLQKNKGMCAWERKLSFNDPNLYWFRSAFFRAQSNHD